MFSFFSRSKPAVPDKGDLEIHFLRVKALVFPLQANWSTSDDHILRDQYRLAGGVGEFGKVAIPLVEFTGTNYPEWTLKQCLRYMMCIYPHNDGFFITDGHYKYAINLCIMMNLSPNVVDKCIREIFKEEEKEKQKRRLHIAEDRLNGATI